MEDVNAVSSLTGDNDKIAIKEFKSFEAASMDSCKSTEHNNIANIGGMIQNVNTPDIFDKKLIFTTTANGDQQHGEQNRPVDQEQQMYNDVEMQMSDSVGSAISAVCDNSITLNSQKTFTMEQLELIRRLRNTGIAPDAIAEAFKELEKIENDLDTLQIAAHNHKRSIEANNENGNDGENEALILTRSSDAIISGLQNYPIMSRSAHSSQGEPNLEIANNAIPVNTPSPTARRATGNNFFRLMTATSASSDIINSNIRENFTNNNDNSEAMTFFLQQIHQQLTSNEQCTIQKNSTESLETLRTMLLLSQHIKLRQQQQYFQDYQKKQRNRHESPCTLSPTPAKKIFLASPAPGIITSNVMCPLEPMLNLNMTAKATATIEKSLSPLLAKMPSAVITATKTSGIATSGPESTSLLDPTNRLSSTSLESDGCIVSTPTARRHSTIPVNVNNTLEFENYSGNCEGEPMLSVQADLKSRDLTNLLNSCGILGNNGKTNHRIMNGDVPMLPSELSTVLSNAAVSANANSQLLSNLNAASSSTLFSLCRKRSSSGSSSNESMSHNNDMSSTAIATTSSSTSVNNDFANSASIINTGNNNTALHGSTGANFLNNTLCRSGANSAAINYEHFQTSSGVVCATSMTSSSTNNNNSCYNGSNGNCRPIRSQRTPMKDITTLDNPAELDDFMKRGEDVCINDMKQFITQFSLRQTTVAMMTGVSQPYISKLLNGNHRELSMRCRKNIYSWYLNCRRHPAKLALFTQDPLSRLETNGDGELIPQRRERYVFRPLLIKILEAYFTNNQFPDSTVRMEIAKACNQALQMDKKGAQLMPKEVVTSQVIANWFANKRKEQRRKSHDEALALAAASNYCNNVTYPSPSFTLPSSNTVALLGSSTHSVLYGPSAPSSAPSALSFQLSSAAAATAASTANRNNDSSEIQLQKEQQEQQQESFFDNINLSSSLLTNVAVTSSGLSIFPTSPSDNTDNIRTIGQSSQFNVIGDGNNLSRSSEGSANSINDNDNYNSTSSIIANIEAIRAAAAAVAAVTANLNEHNDDEHKSPVKIRGMFDSFLDNPHQHLQFLQRSSCGVELSNNAQANSKAELTNAFDISLKQVNETYDGNEMDERGNEGDEASQYDETALTSNISAINDYSCVKLELNFNYGNSDGDNSTQNNADTIKNAFDITKSPQKMDASCNAELRANFLGSKRTAYSPMAQSPNSGNSFIDRESGPSNNFNILFDPIDNSQHRFHCELLTNNLRQQQRQVVNSTTYAGGIMDNPNSQIAAALFQNHDGRFHVALRDNEDTQTKAQRHATTAPAASC